MHFHLPEVIEHENLYSLVARFIHVNGIGNQLKATQAFFNSKEISIANIRLYQSQDGLYEQFYRVSKNAPLLTLEKLRLQLGEVLSNGSLILEESTLQNESFGDVSYWRYCPICFDCDMNHHGVGIWHLAHQLPTTLVCTLHHTNLNEICLKKKYLHEQVWLLHHALRFKKTYEDSLEKHWHNIASMGQIVLNDAKVPFAPWVIRQTIIDTFRSRRFIDGKGALKIQVFEDAFTQFFGDGFVNTLNARLQIKKPRYLAAEVLNGFKGRELHRIILIYWLFGSWQYFKSACDWYLAFNQEEIDKHFLTLQKQKSLQIDALKVRSRQLCESYLLSSDKPNRIEFCRLFYSDFRWLLNYDKAWLDRMLPAHGYMHQMKLKF